MWPRAIAAALLAFLASAPKARAQAFSVRRAADDVVVYTGTLGPRFKDPDVPFEVQTADFSAVREPGEYVVAVPGVGRSVHFRVGADVYDGELANVMLGFYGWRAGAHIAFAHGGVAFEHAAGHLEDGLLDHVGGQVGVHKDGTGGWYDAGDYGKYMPTAAESVYTMLVAWELFSDRLSTLELPFIPEHGSPLPDFLAEVKWELDWMLKMAYDDGSGRVHHKLNSVRFPGFVLPADDTSPRYFSTFSTAATAELVAAMARAARAFAAYDDVTGGYSRTLLAAAQRSHAYLAQHPEVVEYDASVLAAGTYKKMGIDDRFWALAEYWETTGDEAALADFEGRISPVTGFVPNPDWDTTTTFGLLTYALSRRAGRNPTIVAQLEASLEAVASDIASASARGGYGRGFGRYYWGSNGIIARTCLLLQGANRLFPDPRYLDACAAQLGYLYGRNQYNRSFVTGSGIDPPLHPHHRISGSDAAAAPYPGLLVGGGQSPTGWVDLQSHFASNEVAINWNAALVLALAGFTSGASPLSLGRGPVAAADCGVRISSVGYLPDRAKVATVQTECELVSFMCTLQGHTLAGDTRGPLKMIDDLEDGNQQILKRDGRQGAWFVYDDGTMGSRTDLRIEPSGREGSQRAACISAQGFSTSGGGVGIELNGKSAYDASAYTGISFWARGSSRFRLMVVDKYSNPAAGLCTTCNDHFQISFSPTPEWQQYTFSWSELAQRGSGTPLPSTCPAALYALQFQWLANSTAEICLDDVAFTTPEGTAADWPKLARRDGCACDLSPTPPAPPTIVILTALGATWRRRRGGSRSGCRWARWIRTSPR